MDNPDVIVTIIAPIAGVVGVVAGVLLQTFLSRKSQRKIRLAEWENQAYADFLNAASQIAVAQRAGNRANVDAQLPKLADAKARICVYGDAQVIKELANFIRHGSTLQTESEILSFTRLCEAIRKSAGREQRDLYASDISQLLFSVDVANVQTPTSEADES